MTWEQLPDSARVWIYTADRQLTDSESQQVKLSLQDFTNQWAAHARQLSAVGDVWHNRFVVLAVDESNAGASGCSIDSSVHFLQNLGGQLGINFFDRTTFFADNGSGYLPYNRSEFEAAYAAGQIHDRSSVIDTLVDTKAKAVAHFTRPLAESWHARLV